MYARELKFNSRTRMPARQPLKSTTSPGGLHCNSHFHTFIHSHFDIPYQITFPILSMSQSPPPGFPKNTTFGTRKKINGLSLSRFAKK